ncbi:sensor domain-containing diguanylate cyclase [Pseudoduganella albidiflava]|uniref:diguanylate cyclase n=1 Tax=Pseudoduganella albidiflava TaxID=321983 RepID=A0A411WTZ1_9BURK|nr:sensor domain-containing diguanylate cyclase [Pseudoduganella albidiflava]QBI00251.1 sensor domain-containing diguanylate cyclase [Pseudoduganella albidiflava]GGY52444.1 diguanylate cyclase [Pseudoduganella albidiflava]
MHPSRLPLLESVLEAVSAGIVVVDQDRRIVLWNKWMSRHTGCAAHKALGMDLFELMPELRGGRVEAAVTQALTNHFSSLLSPTLNRAPFPLYSNPAAIARSDRMQQAIAVTPLAFPDGQGGSHCLIQLNDVSMAAAREKLLREQTELLRMQTFSDGLTGVANRRAFDAAIDREVRRAKRNGGMLSLLMIDIDHFKPYNDHYGHQKGDWCLIQVSAALQALLQRSVDMLARYGGEEFAVILPDNDPRQALRMAETLHERVLQLAIPHEYGGPEQQVTVSIGVATLQAGQTATPAALIGAADGALYAAKRQGRNRIVSALPEQAPGGQAP